jgi:membrane protein YdbS with pleckstrin-like domain
VSDGWEDAPEVPETARVAPAPPLSAGEPPRRRLAPNAKFAWRLQQIGAWGAATLIGAAIGSRLDGALAAALWLVPLVGGIASVLIVPALRWSRWRWDVRPEAIDIQHGTFTVRRTLVPLVRVQHVDTRRGILEQLLDLSTVVVHTAAGSHTIPLLSVHDADQLRDRIASLARTGDG